MLDSRLYPYIFERKSIRKYSVAPIGPDHIAAILNEISNLVPLFEGDRYNLELRADKFRIYAYCVNTLTGNANIGFVLQQLDLALHGLGLGRLWYGVGRAPSDIQVIPPLSYAICLKVGEADEPLSRQSVDEFKRKSISEVIDDAELYEIFEAVRLAPSATNAQPWLFKREGDAIYAFRLRLGFFKAAIYNRMNQCDMGIALCHAVLALEHNGYSITGIDSAPPITMPAGYEHTATIHLV